MTEDLKISTCGPFKYKMGSSILILSTRMGKFIRMKRVKQLFFSGIEKTTSC